MRIVRAALSLVAAILVVGLVVPRLLPDGVEPLPSARVVVPGMADGCEEAPDEPGIDRTHLDAATAPAASELYRWVPPTSGRHYARPNPVVVDAASSADPRATTHNLEHGAVVVHVDRGRVGPEVAAAVEDWARGLAGAGFDAPDASSGVLVVAMPVDATTDAGVSLRAWGAGIDCDRWDRATGDAFVVRHYGSRGDAPESELAPYPDDNGMLLEGSFI